MAEFAMNYDYPIFGQGDGYDTMPYSVNGGEEIKEPSTPLPPIVICPSEVEHINITLEKNQQCACKDCGKLFNSVWYLKQHAVKHSNDRPFKCKFCFKTYKFRSNLYQHKCPDRQKSGLTGRRGARGTGVGIPNLPGTPTAVQKRLETNALLKTKIESSLSMGQSIEPEEPTVLQPPPHTVSDLIQLEAPPMNFSPSYQPIHGAAPAGVVQSAGGTVTPSMQGYGMEDGDDAEVSYGLCIRIEPAPTSTITVNEYERPPDCIRLQPMPYEEVERYVSSNKTKIHTCRKCKTHFPSEETLERHTAAHRHEEAHCFRCDSCPQTFGSQLDYARHISSHSSMGPWSCDGCSGCFRSNVALRRHIDASRPCRYRPFDVPVGIIESASSPLDPSSFIISEADTMPASEVGELSEREKAESGIGSSPESSMLHTSPARSATNTVDDDFDENMSYGSRKKEKDHDDDADSGFRSRLNSVTQTCSPGSSSAFSSDGGSPHRKSSHDGGVNGGLSLGISSFGTGTAYGQKLFLHEQSVGGQFTSFSSLSGTSIGGSISVPSSIDVATVSFATINDPMAAIRVKESALIDTVYWTTECDVAIDYDDESAADPPFDHALESIDYQTELLLSLLRFVLHKLLPYAALVVIANQYVNSSSLREPVVSAESTGDVIRTINSVKDDSDDDEE